MHKTRQLKKKSGKFGTAVNLLKWVQAVAEGFQSAARKIRCIHLGRLRWQRGIVSLLVCTTVITATLVAIGLYHVYFDRTNLPDIEPFIRFEFPTIGHVYDANGQPLIEMAKRVPAEHQV